MLSCEKIVWFRRALAISTASSAMSQMVYLRYVGECTVSIYLPDFCFFRFLSEALQPRIATPDPHNELYQNEVANTAWIPILAN